MNACSRRGTTIVHASWALGGAFSGGLGGGGEAIVFNHPCGGICFENGLGVTDGAALPSARLSWTHIVG